MEPRAGKETIRETARKEAEDNKLKKRKEKIRSILDSKRFPPTHQTIQTASQRQPESEGKEDTQMKEESKEKNKGYLPMNLHFKKKTFLEVQKKVLVLPFSLPHEKRLQSHAMLLIGDWDI